MRNPQLQVSRPIFDGNEAQYLLECIESGWVSGNGRFVPLFEDSYARYCGVGHGVAVSSGTAALHLALLALGVGPGDEVILPTLTYVATANAVVYCGATPVFADCDPQTWTIDPESLEPLITARTRGLIVVHLFGHPANMDPILEIATRRGLFVLEDAAQAHGAEYKRRRVGGLGDAAIFSFFGNKIITTGEGGMVVTRNPEIADRVRLLRGQGMDPCRRYWFPVIGYNYRMTNLQAAVGLAQLERIEQRLTVREQVAHWYDQRLKPLEDFLLRPHTEQWARRVHWLYTILLRETVEIDRDDVAAALWEQGIETRPVFWPIHLLPPYTPAVRSLPVSESIARRGLSLPTHPWVTQDDVDRVANALAAACQGRAVGT
jgi:perosamine synthetase